MADSYLPDEDAVFVMKKANPSSPQFQRDDRITIYTRIGRTLQRATAEGRPGEPDTMYRVAEIDWLDPRRPLIGLTREDWRFRYFDYGFQSMAVRHDTPLIQFALRRSATQRVARSLGFLDPERTRVATPQSVMRIASVDKPMTRAALEVWMEDSNRKVNKQTSFFGYLRERGVQPAGPVSDPRVWEITFAQMISGRSGLDDSSLSNDGASPEEQAREFMRRPLAAQPGTTGHYPNREYELLRFAIHRECGGDSGFITFLRNAVFQHANVFLSTLGANNPNPRECSYVGAIGYPRNRPLLVATTAEALVTLFSRFRVDDGRPLGAGDPVLCAIEVLNSAGMPVERLNCGGPKVLDPNGPAWSEDKQGGGYTAPPVLGGTGMIPAALYESGRAGGIDYWFKLPKGSYRTKLYFSEPTATAANERLFNLHINENTVLRRFDIFVAAGGQRRPAVQEFRVEAMGEEGIRIAGTPDPKGLWQDGAHYFGGMNGTVAVVEQNLPGGVVGAAIANQRDDNRMDWMRELLRAAALIDGPYWA